MAQDDRWDMTSAGDDSPDELRTLWLEAVARSRAAVDEALADGGPDTLLAMSHGPDTHHLRRVLVDLIEE